MNEAYPWDEPISHAETPFQRMWQGMPSRHEWNSSPFRAHEKTCLHCGYKWDYFSYRYRSNVLMDGHQAAVADHEVCWNCHQVETQPHETRKYWDRVDSPAVGAKQKSGLRQMGDM